MGRNIDFTDQGIGKFFEPLGGGTSAVSVKAPALAGDIDMVLLAALPGVTSNLTITAAGQIGTSVGGGSLDQAYDFGGAGAGRAITADTGGVSITSPLASGNVALELTQADNFACLQVTKSVGGAGSVMLLTNAGTGIGIDVVQNGAGIGTRVTQNGVADAMQIVQTQDDNGLFISKAGLGGGDALVISNLGTSSGIAVDQDGDGPAISTDSAAASTIASILVVNNGTGPGERITQVGDAIGLDIAKTGAGVGQALKIDNDGTGIGLHLIQDGVARAMLIDQNANEDALRIENGGKIGLVIAHSGTGVGLDVVSSSGSMAARVKANSEQQVAQFEKSLGGASKAVEIINAGTGQGLLLDQDGNGVPLDIDSEATSQPLINLAPVVGNTRGDVAFSTARTSAPATPSEGDLWYNSGDERVEFELGGGLTRPLASHFAGHFGATTAKTISAGAITGTDASMVVTSETSTTDDLDDISVTGAGAKVGDEVLIKADSGHTITVRNNGGGTGNIRLDGAASKVLVNNNHFTLHWTGTVWQQLTPMMVLA